jgi:hypothetical protein
LILDDQQCGMNRGTCYSQNSMDRLLIIGGSVVGVLMLCCFVGMFYCIRSSHIQQREIQKTKNHLSFQQENLSYINPSFIPTQTPPSNSIPMVLLSPRNSISQSNNSTSSLSQESSTNHSPEYNQALKYLSTSDQLIQKLQINTPNSTTT